MADADAQLRLRDAWLGGPEDRLCGREQAKAWALRECWREEHDSDHGLCKFVATRVNKAKDGLPNGGNPTGNAVKKSSTRLTVTTNGSLASIAEESVGLNPY